MTPRRAFSMLELIAALVVLALLASLGVPTYKSVMTRSRTEATRTSLSAVARDAQALAALGAGFDRGDVMTAIQESGMAVGTVAAQGVVAVELSPTLLALSTRPEGGGCVLAVARSSEVRTWSLPSSSSCLPSEAVNAMLSETHPA